MTKPAAGLPAALRDQIRAGDAERIRALARDTGFFSAEEEQIAGELAEESLARGEAAGYHYLFCEEGAELVGYTCFGPIPCTQASWDLYWIAVAPRMQGHGLGRHLALATEERIRARGGTRVYVDTSGRVQYRPTRAFYEACGYGVAARFEDFYAPGDDKVVYLKVL